MEDSLTTFAGLSGIDPLLLIAAIIWTLIWKGFALWRAAELKQKYWFIAILLINTLGILEIIYLFLVAKNYKVEVIEEKQ
ncbi:MAG: DUF5652 family protein [Candidatus Colwellbacteria bacterium]|nr:DUF5652 family protein [Candidatus Colwellbacteria bacterium]